MQHYTWKSAFLDLIALIVGGYATYVAVLLGISLLSPGANAGIMTGAVFLVVVLAILVVIIMACGSWSVRALVRRSNAPMAAGMRRFAIATAVLGLCVAFPVTLFVSYETVRMGSNILSVIDSLAIEIVLMIATVILWKEKEVRSA